MEKPEYLYHYTSIEGLAHILSSGEIRFSRLDLLDDMDEGQSQDLVDWRKYFFVSCWTAEKEESIPLWSMYTPNMTGVRLKLPTEMFKLHRLELNDIPKFVQIADTSSAPPGANIVIQSYMPYEQLHGEDYFVMPPSFGKDIWPFEVCYTDDESKLNQKLIDYKEKTGQTVVSSFEIAKYKKKVWGFQKEWRFRIYCHNAAPRSLKDTLPEQDYFNLMLKELSSLGKGINQEYFYMKLSDAALNETEIVLGPKVDKAHEIIVKALIETHCPTASLSISRLAGKIR